MTAAELKSDSVFRKLRRILCRRGKGGKGGRVRASLSVKPASQVSLRSVFSYFDVNGDGKITPEELRTTVGEERMTAEEAAAAVKSLDLDGDGVLGLDEFEQLMMEEARGEDEREWELKEAFQIFKAEEEESEGITASGLKRMLTRLGEVWSMEECRMMIKEFDLDGNGVISFDEFVSMMT
ncbi:unnamed protein product [Rhodiola kirilowii]